MHSRAEISGVGVHSGVQISLALVPAEAGEGLRLRRTDAGCEWPVTPRTVVPSVGCTAIGDETASVMFLEHIMAALWWHGVSDCLIEVSGPEIPLLDGSALPFVEMIVRAGVDDLGEPLAPVVVGEAVRIGDDCQFVAAVPSQTTRYCYLLDHPHPLVGLQVAQLRAGDDFAGEIAPARTFGVAGELEAARAAGLLRGGSEANSIVVFPDRLSADPGLEHAFARHKLLDLIGDLFLLGRPLVGTVIACRSGHRENQTLAAQLEAR